MVTEGGDKPLTGTGSIGEANLRRRIEALEAERDRFKAMSDGWREIGDTLLSAAIGFDMRGFGDIPPMEMLEPIRANSGATHDHVMATLRDSLLGQAWRCRGKDGKGSCDYPLCPQGADRKIGDVHAVPLFAPRPSNREGSLGFGHDGWRIDRVGELHVCSIDINSECYSWARWIAARAKAGRIKVL